MEDVRDVVRDKYGEIAKTRSSCCGPAASCCGPGGQAESISMAMGYSGEELKSVPDDANLGLGCGNPTALASLKEGEIVLDLGSGGGLDCFLAAEKVGQSGKVIGVDMTPEMVSLARKNAEKGNHTNVEFRLGEIENLPVADNTVDAIISNCVINLSADKGRVFREAYRVLKPGGRLMISDIALLKPLPEFVKESIAAYVGCVAGALLKDDYISAMTSAGFENVTVVNEKPFAITMAESSDPLVQSLIDEFNPSPEQVKDLAGSIVSINVEGKKVAEC
ncbi:MAG TPA: arsenite methyltransferase [Desulfatiglandales bacterium]|nr:arsenite methyltransferase [Desulfatiglandales bacterium]